MTRENLLVIQSAYSNSRIEELKLESYYRSKDSGEYFTQVITVNPIASLQDPNFFNKGNGFRISQLDQRHLIVESAHFLKILGTKFPRLSFFASQLRLITRLIFSPQIKNIKCVYGDDPEYNGFVAYIISRVLRVPLVIGVWGNSQRIRENTGKPLMPRLFSTAQKEANFEKYILEHADAIQVLNEENAKYPLSLNIHRSKVSLLPLGVSIAECHFQSPEKREFALESDLHDSNILNIVCVSRLEELKHVDHAIKSMQLLKDRGTKFNLHIVGDGSQMQSLCMISDEMAILESTTFHGNKSQEWLAEFLPKMDIAIAPLTGRALMEIGLAGVPVVAYDVDWHSELVINEETGILVDYLDINQLSKAVLDISNLDSESKDKFRKNIRLKSELLSDPINLKLKQVKFFKDLCNRA